MRSPAAPRTRRQWLGTSALGLSLLVATAALAQELPTGGSVKAGGAAIQPGAAGLTVRQSTPKAVIEWNSFGIGAGASVKFEQPGAGSAILNRVTGPDASRIAGTLSSNGQVFVVNRNGLVVTPTGTIDTRGGFVGSTLDIKDADFMAGRYRFEGDGGTILNQGRILSGPGAAIALIGGQVSNAGLISAPLGRVALASGLAATLDLSGDGFLQLALPADAADAAGHVLVDNSGRIEAEGGRVILQAATARDAVRRLVNMSGVIVARSVSGRDGSVLLDAGAGASAQVSGLIDVSGDLDGGRVDVTGGEVSLAGASLLATGARHGGLVRVGGMFQGGQPANPATAADAHRYTTDFGDLPSLAAARTTTTDAASRIDVSGGAGSGAVVLWSSEHTDQHGAILAPGGAVEVSSKALLSTDLAKVSVGRGGVLLLDPQDLDVLDGFGGVSYSGPVGYADSTSILDRTQVEGVLNGGGDVILRASNSVTWNGGAFVSGAHGGDITISSGGSVSLDGGFALADGDLTIVANDTAAHGVVDAERSAGLADIFMYSAQIQTTGNVTVTMGAGAGVTNAQPGDIRIGEIVAGNITLDNGGQSTSRISAQTNQVVTASGTLTLSGPIRVITTGALAFSGHTINWTNEASSALTGFNDSVITFTENSVLTRYGVLGSGSNQTRLALGTGLASPQYTRAYGAADPTFGVNPHIVSGTLHGADTLAGILTAGSVTASGPASTAIPGDYDVTSSATGTFAFASGIRGYFIDLRAGVDTLRITPKVLTPTVSAGSYVYGSPTNVVSLAGIINSDTVAPVATLSSGGSATLAGSGGAYAFANTMAVGSRTFTLASLAGTNAGNYSLDLSGTISAALTISQKPLNYTILDASSTYGTLATPISTIDTALVGSDAVTVGALTVTKSGVSTTLSATTKVGAYVISLGSLGGADAANYSIATSGNTTAALTVAAKPLSFSVANASSTYGALATAGAASLTGVVGTDDVSGVVQVRTGSTPVTLAARTAAGTYTETVNALSGADAANYTLTGGVPTNGTLTISAKPISFSVTGGSQTYGAQVSVLSLTGVLAGDTANAYVDDGGSTVTLGPLGGGTFGFDIRASAGSHSFTLAGLTGADSGNYSIDLSSGTTGLLTVAAKSLTYALSPLSTTYGTPAAPAAVLTGVVGADDVAGTVVANSGGVTLDLHTAVGSYTLSVSALSGTTAGNYVIAGSGNSNSTLTVGARTITYSLANASSTYGTLASTGSATLNNLASGDSITGTVGVSLAGSPVTVAARTAAGAYALAVSGLTGTRSSNYVIASTGNTDGVLTIGQKSVTFSLGAITSTYGTLATATPTLTGVLGGDAVTGALGFRSGGSVFAPQAQTTAGSYAALITGLGGTDGANYVLAGSGNTEGTLTISPKMLGFSLNTATKVYGDTFTAGAGLTGVLSGDLVSGSVQVTDGSSNVLDPQAVINVGTYTQTVSLTGLSAGNYDLSGGSTGALSITQRPIVAGAQAGAFSQGGASTVAYGVAPSVVHAGYLFSGVNGNASSGVLGGDDIQATVVAPSLPPSTGGYLKAGSYVFTLSGLTGTAAGNYSLAQAFVPATFTVNKASAVSSVTASNATYGTAVPFIDNGMSGLLSGDVVSAASIQGFPTGGGSAVALTTQTPAGRYTVQVSGLTGADAANYTLSSSNIQTVTIFQKPLTYVTSSSTSTYGTLASLGSAVLTGKVGSDVVNGAVDVLGGGLTARSGVGTYSVVVSGLSGGDASNYVVASSGNTRGALTISPLALTYTYTSANLSSVFGTATAAWDVQLHGVLTGDTVAPTVQAKVTSLPDPAAGTIGTAYTPNGVTLLPVSDYNVSMARSAGKYLLTGASAGNYVLADDNRASLGAISITPRPVTGVALARVAVYGDGSTASAIFVDEVAASPVTYGIRLVNPATEYSAGAASAIRVPVGLYKMEAYLTGSSRFNYTLADNFTGDLTIKPRPITVTANSKTYTYGDTLSDLITLSNPLGDDLKPVVTINAHPQILSPSPNGSYSFDTILSVGSSQITVTGLTGADIGNYTFTNPGATGTITITPKPVTWSVADVTGYYSGRRPCTALNCVAAERLFDPGDLTTGAVTFSGLVGNDSISAKVKLVGLDGGVSDYAETTRVGTYFQVATELTGNNSANYSMASAGNTPGVMTITPVPVTYTVSGGGRLYQGDQVIALGTPGVVTVDIGRSTPGFLPGDDVRTGPVVLYQKGDLYTKGEPLFPGLYLLEVLGITGADASQYKFIPYDYASKGNTSHPGSLQVQDADVFDFSFIGGGSDPLATYNPAPPSGAVVKAYADAQAKAAASVNVGTIKTTVSASAGADAKAGVSVGAISLTVDANATTSALAQFGAKSIKVSAQVEAAVSVTLAAGPAYITYGADAQAGGNAKVSLSLKPEVKLNALAKTEVTETVGLQGDLGGGVDGKASTQAALFVEARTNNEMVLDPLGGTLTVKTQEFVGVGASAGGTVGLSGGGVGGDASATVYSPGSLYIGSTTSSGFDDGKLNLGFSLGLAIGIGGVNLGVNLSIDTTGIQSAGKEFASQLTSGLMNSSSCDNVCQAQQNTTAATKKIDALYSGGDQGINMILAIQAKPDVVSTANFNAGELYNIQRKLSEYQNITQRISDLVYEEFELTARMSSNPSSITAADLTEAASIRSRELSLAREASSAWGAKLSIKNGTITMAPL